MDTEANVVPPGREFRQADRQRDEFIATLGHELANPLAAARNALAILRGVDLKDPTGQWAREIIERQIDHLVRLVEGFLAVGRLSQGKIKLDKQPVLVADVIRRAVEMIRPLIDMHRQRLTVALPPAPLFVEGDRVRLTQALSNLLHNAVKFTQEGGQIAIRLERRGDEAVLTVADNGIGIASDLLPHVFDLYTQAEGAVGRAEDGLGIGLTVAHRLIEGHGGRIEARSEGEHNGAEFIIWLPRLSHTAEVPGLLPPISDRRPAAPPQAPCRRILLVDDSFDAAESIAILGNLQGNEVRWAISADTGVQLARELQPHMVVVDLGSRNVDGYAVARRLRLQAGARQPVVVALTGYHQAIDRQRAELAGFNHYLPKPIDMNAWATLFATLGPDRESIRPAPAGAI